MSGDAVYAATYEYGVDNNGLWSKELRNGGSDWTQTWVNLVGQPYRGTRSGTSNVATVGYDAKGRPISQQGFDQISEQIGYDDHRNLVNSRTVGNRHLACVYAVTGGMYRTTTTIGTGSGASVITEGTSFDGLDSLTTVNGRDTSTHRVRNGGGGWTVTTTYPDGTKTASTIDAAALAQVQDQTTSETGFVTVNYTADPLLRIKTMADRSGTTTCDLINGVGQVDKVSLPNGQVWQKTARDQMLQLTGLMRPDGKTVNWTYGSKSEFTGSTGAGTYDSTWAAGDARGMYTNLNLTANGGADGLDL